LSAADAAADESLKLTEPRKVQSRPH
jgi:hypothetical protein